MDYQYRLLKESNLKVPGVSEKKYDVEDYHYFKNGNTQQYNIWHNKHNFYLVVCEVSTPYVKHTKNLTWEKWWVKRDLYRWSGPPGPKRVPHGQPVKQTNNKVTNLNTDVFYHLIINWTIIPLTLITLVTFAIWGWNSTLS